MDRKHRRDPPNEEHLRWGAELTEQKTKTLQPQ